MSGSLVGAGLGLLGAAGVIAVIRFSPPMRRARLDARLAPYVRDAVPSSMLLRRDRTRTPFPTVERLVGPLLADLASFTDKLLGGSVSVVRRLDQAGGQLTLEEFRAEQVVWAAAGLGVGLLLAAISATRDSAADLLAFLIVGVVLAVVGVVAREQLLNVRVRRREQRMVAEFPTIAELLALAVAAGEGAVGALERVTRSANGDLAAELGRALADARSGASLIVALESMAGRTSLAAVARFVDGMAIAIERGTPLADVLRAQAADVREQGRRELLEAGGRKEIQMLVPVVFAVLPVTVIFALFPGLATLRLAVP